MAHKFQLMFPLTEADIGCFRFFSRIKLKNQMLGRLFLGTLALLVFPILHSNAFASCGPSQFEICRKFRLLAAEMYDRPASFFSKSSPIGTYCRVKLEDISNGEIVEANTKACPKIKDPEYLYVRPACNDVRGILPAPDVLEVWSARECEFDPSKNLKRVKSLVEKITVGKRLENLGKLRLRIAGERLTRSPPGGGDFVAVLHSFPGVSVDVVLSRCEKNTETCDRTQFDTWPVKEVKVPKKEFLTTRECLLWGGKPGKLKGAETFDFSSFDFGEARPCAFGANEAFQSELVNGLPPKVGPIQDLDDVTVLSVSEGERLLEDCPRAFPGKPSSFWIPNEIRVREIEARAADQSLFSKVLSKNQLSGVIPYRQYLGIVVDGRKLVQVRVAEKSFVNSKKMNWKLNAFSECTMPEKVGWLTHLWQNRFWIGSSK